jgi:hypothetical protein
MVSSVNGFWFWPATKPTVVKASKAGFLPSHILDTETQSLIERISKFALANRSRSLVGGVLIRSDKITCLSISCLHTTL